MSSSRKRSLYAIALLACAAAPAQAEEVPIDVATLKAAVLSETNAYRESKKLPQLQENAALSAAGAAYAMYLAEHEGTGHTADGKTPAKRVSAQGYQWCFVAENVWGGWRKPDTMLSAEAAAKAMDGWKKSPGHNANLLEKRVRDIGIGAAAWKQAGGKDVFRIVQVFGEECRGKPRPAPSIGEVLSTAADALR
ncbi:MAG: CAP domain-containing protein [Rhodomicrobium sp.]